MREPILQSGPKMCRIPGELEFEELVRAYRSRIFGYALLSLRDRDAAETLTQDCFLRAHQGLGSFRGECSAKTWLMRIAINLVRDQIRNRRFQFWRKLRASPEFDLESASARASHNSSPEAALILKEDAAAVWSGVRTLPQQQRTVFLLRFVEDMDILEIVEATGMKEGTVKTHLFRALRSLRLKLRPRL